MTNNHSLRIISEINEELKKTLSPRNLGVYANTVNSYSMYSPKYNVQTKATTKQDNTLSLTLSPQNTKFSTKTEESASDVLYSKITGRIKKMMEDVDTKCTDITNKISSILNAE